MAAHLYSIGQEVELKTNRYTSALADEPFRVTALLPVVNGTARQYRIRADREPHERVVAEADLVARS